MIRTLEFNFSEIQDRVQAAENLQRSVGYEAANTILTDLANDILKERK